MKKLCFALMVLAQLSVPVYMIVNAEITMQKGTVYKFRVRPYDPYDMLRGRYVRYNVTLEIDEPDSVTYDRDWYFRLAKDDEGFAYLAEVAQEPGEGDWVQAGSLSSAGGKLLVRMPFDRLYMKEDRAIAIDKLLWARNRDCHITVRFRDGEGLVENLYIDGVPFADIQYQKDNADDAPTPVDPQ